MSDTLYIANLSFLLNYTDGSTSDEVASELYRTAFQTKGATHYARGDGGSFENIEQEQSNEVVLLKYITNIIESIYRLNVKKAFTPYIVVGWDDVASTKQTSEYVVTVHYRLLQDLQKEGSIAITL